MQKTSVGGGQQQYPQLSEPNWSPRNIEGIEAVIRQTYPQAWTEASTEVNSSMPQSVKGIVGRVAANIERIDGIESRQYEANTEALKTTTADQWSKAFSDTNDRLNIWGDTPQEKQWMQDLIRHWNNKLEGLSGDVAGGESEFMMDRAKILHGTWHDIVVVRARQKAVKLRQALITTQQMGNIPKTKE